MSIYPLFRTVDWPIPDFILLQCPLQVKIRTNVLVDNGVDRGHKGLHASIGIVCIMHKTRIVGFFILRLRV